MGKKTRSQIKKERAKAEFLAYQELIANPEFIRICEKVKAIEEKQEEIKSQLKKLFLPKKIDSQLKKLPSPHPKGLTIEPNDPHYSIISKRQELDQEYSKLGREKMDLINTAMNRFKLITFINPLVEEWSLENFSGTGSIFEDKEIVRDVPFEEPRWNPEINDVDYSGYLRDNRYLSVEIDTWHKRENIIDAPQNKLDCLEGMGIIQYKKKIHLSTDEERIKAKKLQEEGKSLREIAYSLWPVRFDKEEKKIAKGQNVVGEERTLYEGHVTQLVKEGKTLGQAYKEADKKFRLKGKTAINPLIPKVYYLLKIKN